MADHIKFSEIDLRDGRVTKAWAVMTNDGAACLGRVAWYSPWRKHCFFPSNQTLFEEDCLRRISFFIVTATEERKRERKTAVTPMSAQQQFVFSDEAKAGIEASYEHADRQWRGVAYAAIGKIAATREQFTMDDVAAELGEYFCSTHTMRALGGIMVRIRNEKIAEPTGEYVNSVRKNQHHCPIKVWRSLVFRLRKDVHA